MSKSKSELRRKLDLLYHEINKSALEAEHELNSFMYNFDEAQKAKKKLTLQIMELCKKIKAYDNMTFKQRAFFLFYPKGVKND